MKNVLFASAGALMLASSAFASAPPGPMKSDAIKPAQQAAPATSAMSNLYVTGFAGMSVASKLTGDGDTKTVPKEISEANAPPFDASLQTGWLAGAGVGYRLNSLLHGLRVEGDITYLSSGISKLSNSILGESQKEFGHSNINSLGSISVTTTMANAFYDINTGSHFTPYIGAGLGAAFLSLNKVGVSATRTVLGIATKTSITNSSSSTQFAYDGQVGVAYSLTPKMQLTAGYEYLATLKKTLPDSGVNITEEVDGVPADIPSTVKTHYTAKNGYSANLIKAGFTYFF